VFINSFFAKNTYLPTDHDACTCTNTNGDICVDKPSINFKI